MEILREFIKDSIVIIPLGVSIALILVMLVLVFDIEPIKSWLYEED